ncbi:hypothetical protein I8741_26440, partial [Escherichia coli]
LAELLGAFVTLSVPGIKLVDAAQLQANLLACDMAGDAPSPVRQAFQSDISGEAIVLFGKDGREELEELMGYDDADLHGQSEALSDIANLLVGA